MKTSRSLAMFLVLALLPVVGCSDTNPLGGQEGEPLGGQEGEPLAPGDAGEPPPPAAPDFDTGVPDDSCEVVASCEGPAWCADYTAGTVPPDFDQACEDAGGMPATVPCDATDAIGVCTGSDDCTVVWLYGTLGDPPVDYCDSLSMTFESID